MHEERPLPRVNGGHTQWLKGAGQLVTVVDKEMLTGTTKWSARNVSSTWEAFQRGFSRGFYRATFKENKGRYKLCGQGKCHIESERMCVATFFPPFSGKSHIPHWENLTSQQH